MYRIIYVELFNGGFCEPYLLGKYFETKEQAKQHLLTQKYVYEYGDYTKIDCYGCRMMAYVVTNK